MPRRSGDFENPRDNNWRHLWEQPSKKSYRRRARAWLRQLSSDPPHLEDSVVPAHSSDLSDPIAMVSNQENQSLEDQFLRWRQDMETKQEEQAKQMVELRNHANHLQQENDLLWACLEEDQGENARESSHPAPPVKQNKDKEPILPGDSDAAVDDELSSGSSSLPDLSLPKNNMEAESRKRPSCRSNLPSVACIAEYEEKLVESDDNRSKPPKMCPRGTMAWHHHFRSCILPLGLYPPRTCLSTTVRGPKDMLSSPLG